MKRLMTIFTMLALFSVATFGQTECEAYFSSNSEGLTVQLEGYYYGGWDPVSGDSIPEEATFEWSFLGMTETGSSLTFTVDEAGTYEICLTATGASSGCTSTFCDEILIGVDELSLELVSGYEIEGDYTSGWAAAIAEGGIAPYAYQWSNDAVTQEIVGLTPGTYCVTVIDAAENTLSSCITLFEDSTEYPIDTLGGLFILGFEYEYYEVEETYFATVAAYIEGGEAPYTYEWIQETEFADPLMITHESEANYDIVEGVIPGYPVFLEVTDALGETAMGSIIVPEYEFAEDSIIDELGETVDTCLIDGELASVSIDDFWIEDELLFVTWVFTFVGGEAETLTISYADAADLIEGIYEIILYIDCPDGFKSISSFSDRIHIDQTMLSIANETDIIKSSLYPNPVQDVLNISIENNNSPTTISLTDMYGRIIESRTIHSTNAPLIFNTSKLPSGMYFVTIQTEGHVESLKFMK